MLEHPFSLLEPHREHLRVQILAKRDASTNKDSPNKNSSVRLKQVHGNTAVVIHEQPKESIDADGVLTKQKHLPLTITWADCQSFIIYVPQVQIVGLIHAGWRGLLKGMIPSFFVTLYKEWGIEPKETIVCAGPSLCLKCSEFTDPKKELPGIPKEFFQGRCVDLRAIADAQFKALDIPSGNFERHSDCTRCDPEKYWTYRGGDRDAVKQGACNRLVCEILQH